MGPAARGRGGVGIVEGSVRHPVYFAGTRWLTVKRWITGQLADIYQLAERKVISPTSRVTHLSSDLLTTAGDPFQLRPRHAFDA